MMSEKPENRMPLSHPDRAAAARPALAAAAAFAFERGARVALVDVAFPSALGYVRLG